MEPYGFQLADHVLVRKAGFDFSVLAEVQCRRTLAIACELDAVFEQLQSRKDRLCERLYQAICGETDDKLRHKLLQLKRGVFNDRVATNSCSVESLATRLQKNPSLVAELSDWEERARIFDRLLREGEKAAASEWDCACNRLAQYWRNPRFQTAILCAQPQLYRDISRLFCSSTISWKKRDQRTEKALLAYFYRMATKAVPFSFFATVNVCELHGSAHQCEATAIPDTNSFFTLNSTVLQRLVSRLLADEELRQYLPVYLNETVVAQDEEICLLASPADSDESSGKDGDSVIFIGINAALSKIINCLHQPPHYPTVRDLTITLKESIQVDERRAAALIDRLIELGLLRLSLNYDSNHVRSPEDLSQSSALERTAHGRQISLTARHIQHTIDSLALLEPTCQAEALTDIRKNLEAAMIELGATNVRIDEQTLVHHTCIGNTKTILPKELVDVFLPDLCRITGVLPMFNVDYLFHQAINSFFLAQYGRTGLCGSALKFFYEFSQAVLDRKSSNGPGESDGTSTPVPTEAKQLAELRNSFTTDVAEHVHGAAGTCELPIDFWEKWTKKAAPFAPRRAPLSAGFLAQLCKSQHSCLRLVINKVVPGYGTLFAPCSAEENPDSARSWLAVSLRRTFASLIPDAEIVELVGTFGFNGQIRPRLTETYLAYPGESRKLADRRVIPWNDLAINFDDHLGTAMLIRKSTRQKLIPLHLGTLATAHLPAFYRFFSCFGPAFCPDMPLLELLEEARQNRASGEIYHYPRVQTGNVVLLRESWSVPSECVPVPEKSETQFAYFRRLRSWAKRAGFPRRMFVFPMRLSEYLQSDLSARHFRRLHKPFFVDWDDILSHQLFQRFTRLRQGTLLMSEMLPLPEEIPSIDQEPARSTEYLFELYSSGSWCC